MQSPLWTVPWHRLQPSAETCQNAQALDGAKGNGNQNPQVNDCDLRSLLACSIHNKLGYDKGGVANGGLRPNPKKRYIPLHDRKKPRTPEQKQKPHTCSLATVSRCAVNRRLTHAVWQLTRGAPLTRAVGHLTHAVWQLSRGVLRARLRCSRFQHS